MKKLILMFLLLGNLLYSQNTKSIEYNETFNNICKNLDKNYFNIINFESSVRLFIFAGNKILISDEVTNDMAVAVINEVFSYLKYNKYKISESHSYLDHGFIVNLYLEERMAVMYIVLSKDEKIQTVLIR